ncbi:peptide/nickel transport system substrate-binding protein [Arthrobacter silviterrae]|uniref:ABC transporter family substrate-binding protein n=1 Tax=Arthrobacter silviterrae TaxID=2026658 RepID=A0ABX0D7M9_9MICC|nr:ABC transporter family substrate-binding protein [Arthrobacter silviterrae]MDQ0277271.1 peptide/nickel transport system substrate-binding protein [Arthrobacter silviterrae]NGN82882.1 ABC transporter family substrate-binding protein [Arthrobacter silviterrae]
MRAGRISKALTVAVATVLALGACTGTPPAPNNPTSTATAVAGGNVTVLESTPFTSFNAGSVTGSSATNARVDYATHSGFNYVDPGLKIVKNDKFGKYEKISDNPLVVKYTINNGVQWSDGAPVTAADLLLQWAADSGYYNDATLDATFKVVKGTSYFHATGDTTGLSHTALPVIGDNGMSLTLSYTKPFSDWETALGSTVSIPAHIVAVRAGLKDADALTALLQTVPKGDAAVPVRPNAELKKVADFWNTGFDTKSMPDPSLALSNGPYLVKSVTAGHELVLTRNVDYTWGPTPKLDTLTVHYAADSQAQVAALTDKTADVISPPDTADVHAQLEAMKTAKIAILQGQGLGFDQAVLNFKGVFAKADLRTAFLKTVPRQDIVDQLAQPLESNAGTLDSFVFRPAQTPYKESARSNGTSGYAKADIDAAKTLLAGAKPTIRILYNKDDPVRAEEYSLISASAQLAGFTVTDAGKPAGQWQQALKEGAFDVALYGWTSNATGSVQVPQIFKTGAESNLNNFSNTVVDQLAGQLAGEPDDAKQNALKMQIDKLVVDAGYGLPLFQRLGLAATGPHVAGVAYSPVPVGVWWNVWDWSYVK